MIVEKCRVRMILGNFMSYPPEFIIYPKFSIFTEKIEFSGH